jgi:hypothetical protein
VPDSERRVLNIVRQQARRLNTTIDRLFPGATSTTNATWTDRPSPLTAAELRDLTVRRT